MDGLPTKDISCAKRPVVTSFFHPPFCEPSEFGEVREGEEKVLHFCFLGGHQNVPLHLVPRLRLATLILFLFNNSLWT